MNENSPISARPGDEEAGAVRIAEGAHDDERGNRLAENDEGDGREDCAEVLREPRRGQRASDGHKKSTAKASRRGDDSLAARWLKGLSLRITPAKKAPSANETPKSLAAP